MMFCYVGHAYGYNMSRVRDEISILHNDTSWLMLDNLSSPVAARPDQRQQ